MKIPDADSLDQKILQHPLILQLGEMVAEIMGLRVLVVYPNEDGWSQYFVGVKDSTRTEFCRLIHSTREGGKHCKMCHVLMTTAASTGGEVEHRCHLGCEVLVTPVDDSSLGAVAVLSFCMFPGKAAWPEVRKRGIELGVDLVALRKAFLKLPQLNEKGRRGALQIMRALGTAIQEVKRNYDLQQQLLAMQKGGGAASIMKELIRNSSQNKLAEGAERTDGVPMLVRVVCDLIRQRPDLPLSVKELATVARLTPNHFTSLFHRHTGQIFTEYLSNERLKRAKQYLVDLTLSINEVARLVGYDDPSYFTRWFRQHAGASPREWREKRPAEAS
ncbi:MAG: helix-turn-helix domain-containing protein [bacterium]